MLDQRVPIQGIVFWKIYSCHADIRPEKQNRVVFPASTLTKLGCCTMDWHLCRCYEGLSINFKSMVWFG